MYRKQLHDKNRDSPRTKTMSVLKGQRVTTETKKVLLFHHAFIKGIKDKYQKTKSTKYRQLILKTISNGLLKKYRLQKIAKTQLALSKRSVISRENPDIDYKRKRRNGSILQVMAKETNTFLCRDDNSRLKAGKKSTKTKAKEKKQVHLLNDSLRNLHLKFLAENESRKLSYSLFCRLKPFNVRHPTNADRETCLCKKHENLQFKVNKLKQMKLLESSELQVLAANTVCDVNNLTCLYRTCTACSQKRVQVNGDYDPGQMVEWWQWKTRKLEKTISHSSDKGQEVKVVSMTLKEKEKGTINQLVEDFQEEMDKTLRHLYNIKHQYEAVRSLKQKLGSRDVLIHVDFSENLTCKYESEIQSVHFGASQRQISLHTGVMYLKDKSTSFCSISDNLKHGPAAIWGHLRPVLQHIRSEYPTVTNLYVISDGPTTQYRNKDNFYLLTKVPFDLGFTFVDWSFMEAGHGKGAPDGVGAVVKREADRAVLQGSDIVDGESLKDKLVSRNIAVKLFIISDEDIRRYDEYLEPLTIKPVPGTMKIHQVR